MVEHFIRNDVVYLFLLGIVADFQVVRYPGYVCFALFFWAIGSENGSCIFG
jgi:hypothetical protein